MCALRRIYDIYTGMYKSQDKDDDLQGVSIGAVSGNEIIKINLLLHAFPVVTAKERNVISIAFRHRSVHDGHNCRGTTGQWS